MRITLTSIFVDEQDKALRFYTEVLGFVKKQDFPVGAARWLTVVSPEEPDGTELVLEPNENPAAQAFQKALVERGIPLTAFIVDSVEDEYERLRNMGVAFTAGPTVTETATIAIFDDTCGNVIMIAQDRPKPA